MPDSAPTSPMLLSLNTCTAGGSVALGRLNATAEGFEILDSAEFSARMHSAQLIPRIGELLLRQQAAIRDIAAIVVVRGPGSFTGIRVGLSTAKGLAEGAGIPVIAVSRLALLAFASGLPHVLAIADAGRGQYYLGEYLGGRMVRESLLCGDALAALRQPAAQPGVQPGAGVLVCTNACNPSAGGEDNPAELLGWNPVYIPEPDAATALRFAIDRFRAGSFENVETLDANYLRRSGLELFGAPDPSGKTLSQALNNRH